MEDEKRLRGLEQNVERIRVILERMENCLEGQKRWIEGNGGYYGAKVRLDRLEQNHKYSKWLIGIMSIPIIGGLVKYLLNVL